MILPIAQLGQPVLRAKADAVPKDEISRPEFQEFLDNMIETLSDAQGVGLAAPQVFQSKRVFLAKILPPAGEQEEPGVEVFINPRVVKTSEDKVSAWEGCLSFPELQVLVPRFSQVRVEYYDREGEPKALLLKEFPARVFQHEFDHLEGTLTLDRAESTKDIVKTSEIETVLKDREPKDESPSEQPTSPEDRQSE